MAGASATPSAAYFTHVTVTRSHVDFEQSSSTLVEFSIFEAAGAGRTGVVRLLMRCLSQKKKF